MGEQPCNVRLGCREVIKQTQPTAPVDRPSNKDVSGREVWPNQEAASTLQSGSGKMLASRTVACVTMQHDHRCRRPSWAVRAGGGQSRCCVSSLVCFQMRLELLRRLLPHSAIHLRHAAAPFALWHPPLVHERVPAPRVQLCKRKRDPLVMKRALERARHCDERLLLRSQTGNESADRRRLRQHLERQEARAAGLRGGELVSTQRKLNFRPSRLQGLSAANDVPARRPPIWATCPTG